MVVKILKRTKKLYYQMIQLFIQIQNLDQKEEETKKATIIQ